MSSLTKEAAEQLLFEGVHVPVFFDRLRQHGIVPQNQAEQHLMLKAGAVLQDRLEQQPVVQEVNPLLQKFAAELDASHRNSLQEQQAQQNVGEWAKQAAANPQ